MTAGVLLIAWANRRANGLPWWVWTAVAIDIALATPGIILMLTRVGRAIIA